MSRWSRLPTEFLLYWRECQTADYVEAVTLPLNKQGKRTAGTLARIDIGTRTLQAIGRELTRRQGEWGSL